MTDPTPPPDSLLSALTPPAPDMDMDMVEAYDAAMNRGNRVIAALTAQLARERDLPDPDPERIARLTARRSHFVETRARLDAHDPAGVAAFRRECIQVLRADLDPNRA